MSNKKEPVNISEQDVKQQQRKKTKEKNKGKNKGKNKAEGGDKNNEAQLTPGPKQTIIGNPNIKYYILNKRFSCDKVDDDTIYYHGEIHYEDGLVTLKASFMCFDELNEAAKMFRCAHQISHPRVLKAHFYSFDHDINKALVCFEKFDCFLHDIPEPYSSFLNDPTYSFGATITVSGNPNSFIQREIRDINDAVMTMHKTNISSSKLHLENGYFFCAHDEMVVKIMADTLYEDMSVAGVVEWINIKSFHVDNFMEGLERYFAKTTGFEGSRIFIDSLSAPDLKRDKLLLMISTHPFLEDEAQKILDGFSRLFNGIKARDRKMIRLWNALRLGEFDNEFLKTGNWSIGGMHPNFNAVFSHPNGNYQATVYDILRFIRNVYEHRNNINLSPDVILTNIQSKWPYLHYRLHECLFWR